MTPTKKECRASQPNVYHRGICEVIAQSTIDDIEQYWTPAERPAVEHKLTYSFVGQAETVRKGLAHLIEQTKADELIANMRIFDPAAGLRTRQYRMAPRSMLFTVRALW